MGNNFLDASKELHETNPNYGKASEYQRKGTMKNSLCIPKAVQYCQEKHGAKSFLDHGTGKGGLIHALKTHPDIKVKITGYDPAVKQFASKPDHKYDIVSSIDVLEHIGITEINETIAEIQSLTEGFFFFCIDLLPASKKTRDNRNAHFLIAPPDWWIQKLQNNFKILTCMEVGETEDGSRYPMHLFGGATNSMEYFSMMNDFLQKIEIANKRWVLRSDGIVTARNY